MSALSLDSAEVMRRWTELLICGSIKSIGRDEAEVVNDADKPDQLANVDEPDVHSISSSQDQTANVHNPDVHSVSSSHDQTANVDDPEVHSVSSSHDQTANVDDPDVHSVSSGLDQALGHDHAENHSTHTASEHSDSDAKQSDETADECSDDGDQQSDQTYLSQHADQKSHQSYLSYEDEKSDHVDQQSDRGDQRPVYATAESGLADQPSGLTDEHSETSSGAKDHATQTDPVNISTPLQSPKLDPVNIFIPLQSPKLSGTRPPPSTPETFPDLTSINVGISELIVNELGGIKPLGMEKSRHAPRPGQISPRKRFGYNNRYQSLPRSGVNSGLDSHWPSPSPVISGDSEIGAPATAISLPKKAIDNEHEKPAGSLDSVGTSNWFTLSPSKPKNFGTVIPGTPNLLSKTPVGEEGSPDDGNSVDNDEDNIGDGNSIGDKSIDYMSVDSKSVDDEPGDDKSDDDRSVDDNSVNDKPVDDKSIDDKSSDEKSVDDNSVDGKSSDGKSVDDKSMDDKSLDHKPVENRSNDDRIESIGANLPPHLRGPEYIEGTQRDPVAEVRSINRSAPAQAPQRGSINEENSARRTDPAEAPQRDSIHQGNSNHRPDLAEASQRYSINEGNSIHRSNPAEVPRIEATRRFSRDDSYASKSDLSPSSVIFRAVPPPPTINIEEDREHQLFFRAWGAPEARVQPPARIRKVIIRNIPEADPSLVVSLVWGGVIDEIIMKTGSAEVIFADAEECENYYRAAVSGILYRRNDVNKIAYVEKGKDVDVVGGLMQIYLDKGFTRVVRAIGVPDEFTAPQLRAKATFKNRRLESIEDGKLESSGIRYVIFRFCSIRDSVMFKKALEREEEWEHCNIHYHTDPCAAPNPAATTTTRALTARAATPSATLSNT